MTSTNSKVKDGDGSDLYLKGTGAGTDVDPRIPITGLAAGENHEGSVGGDSVVATGSFNRPANTTAYAIGDLVANNTTAGSVTPVPLAVARKNGGTGIINRLRLTKSGTSLTNASFRVHLFKTSPTVTVGDNAAFDASGVLSCNDALAYLGHVDITMDQAFSDGAKGIGTPAVGSAILFAAGSSSQNIYALIEVLAAYTPVSGETLTLAAEVMQD